LAAPINLACLVLVAGMWAAALALIGLPVWYRFLPGGQARLYESGGVAHGVVGSVPGALPWALAGVVLLLVAGWTTQAAAVGPASLAATLLGPDPRCRSTATRADADGDPCRRGGTTDPRPSSHRTGSTRWGAGTAGGPVRGPGIGQ